MANHPSIVRIERLNYGIGAAVIAIGALTQPRAIALGLAVGTLLTCINFFVLRKLVIKWTRAAATGQGGNASFLVMPKMLGLLAAVGLAIVFVPMNVVAFTIGYSIFIISIVIEGLYSVLRTSDDDPVDSLPTTPSTPPTSSEHNHHG